MYFKVANGDLYNLDAFEAFEMIDLHGSKAVVGYFRGRDRLLYIGTSLTEVQAKQILDDIATKLERYKQYVGILSSERRLFT